MVLGKGLEGVDFFLGGGDKVLVCSNTNQKLWSMQYLYDSYNIAKYILLHIVFKIVPKNSKVQKNLNLANFTGWLKGTSLTLWELWKNDTGVIHHGLKQEIHVFTQCFW